MNAILSPSKVMSKIPAIWPPGKLPVKSTSTWVKPAAQTVAILRAVTVEGVRNDELSAIVNDLTAASPEFARLWANYRLFEHTHGVKHFFNEAVGEMKLNYETLTLSGDGQSVIVYSADPGSPSEEKLALLSSWAASVTT